MFGKPGRNYVRPWKNLGALLAWRPTIQPVPGEAFLKARSLEACRLMVWNTLWVSPARASLTDFKRPKRLFVTAISLEPLEWCHRVALAVLYEKKLARYSGC